MADIYCICIFFFFNDTATTEIYTLSLHDALPISVEAGNWLVGTPESITEKLMKVQDRYPGLDMVNVGQVIGTPQEVIEEQLQKFGEDVIPHFS